MSRLDNVDALEKQLAELQMVKNISSPGKVKKIPPAVPPKKKAQPQVPHSAAITAIKEPSYSSKIAPLQNNVVPPPPPTYGNVPRFMNNVHSSHKDYANVKQLALPSHPVKQTLPLPPKSINPLNYTNLPTYQGCPPPPPPPPFYMAQSKALDSNHNNEEYLPPPSPVSSNYSELMQATANINYNQDRQSYPAIYQNDYPEYGVSQASTYESLYEPINPHPTSTRQTNNNREFKGNIQPNKGKSPLAKEEEVDALTNLLVQSITDSQDLDVFGTCVKCNQKVIGESSGCTAMGNMYHIQCFSCHRCNVNLRGKPFYAVEGNPYCETDYYETLEKCSVCENPILDRILRATGKPYHPSCFTCVVCGKSLEGIPFTVDAMNQIHCIEDFHKKFAPRCCVCELPIMPEEDKEETVRVVAADRSFHVLCYKCEDCGLLLSAQAEGRKCYPLDGHILCRACNAHRIRLLTNVMTTDL
ncbi:lipoma-preferred partner homolog [Danaus plexippus]|uniref:Zyxin n=1 Tax=Danaus plexippus plexippus TaxID=278856 RepID=A0A212FGX6_DANPL|nr:lipoma-preferred partner homolog [Danaus plexippus]OWR53001.1 putative lipoma preferred partner/lpp [Danaus plexippus plexippus]